MKIVVYGFPAPQGSKSFKGLSKAGRAILTESSKKVKPWREDVKAAAELVLPEGWVPLDQPVHLHVVFTLPAPSSLRKRTPSHPKVTPDLSKLVRSTEDALTAAGVWKDDARVVECMSVKTYPQGTLGAHHMALSRPGAVIHVVSLGD